MKLASTLVTSALLLSACASPARMEHMQLSASDPAHRLALAAPQELRNQIGLHDVTGGKETNPLWFSEVSSSAFRDALEASMKSVGLYAPGALGDYKLVVHLEKLDQPAFGLDMTVTATVNYTLEQRKTGRIILARTITTPHTATFSDAAIGTERIRLAYEGTIRKNISAIITELLALDKGKISISVK